MNDLFKQIYERSDPETRRAMIKSYQTSGGTVLSTNWGEVNDKDYEGADRPSAPDGQKWANEQWIFFTKLSFDILTQGVLGFWGFVVDCGWLR
jgi:hypothetical protein